jgi:hypothetical protein
LFFRKAHQRTDFKLGLAGLTAGIHALRLQAQSGQASQEDLRVSFDGVKAILDGIPATDLSSDKKAALFAMMDSIIAMGKPPEPLRADAEAPPVYRPIAGHGMDDSHVEKWDGQKWVVTRNPDSIGEAR